MFKDRMFNGERFFRGGRRTSSFQKGDLKYVILNLMKEKPRHGYEIIRELEEQSYGLYKPSPGVIYPTIMPSPPSRKGRKSIRLPMRVLNS